MKKSRIAAAFLSAFTAVSALAVNASAMYIKEGDTPVFDVTPTVEGSIERIHTDLGGGFGQYNNYYVDENGEPVTGYSLLYIDYSYSSEIGSEMRMMLIDEKTGEIESYYTGFTKSSKGRRYYLRGERIYGWYKIGSYWYHFDENGYADTGRVKICGAYYTFDEKGRWQNKVSKSGCAPEDFTLYIEDIHGMSGYSTDGYIYYGEDYDGKEYTKNIKFSVRDRQVMYCMFLESGIAAGEETKYDDIYKLCEKHIRGEGTEHLEIWELEPAFGFKVTVTCDGESTKLVFNDTCSQFCHRDEDWFDAYRFTENLYGYRLNYLYKKFPKSEGVDWVMLE